MKYLILCLIFFVSAESYSQSCCPGKSNCAKVTCASATKEKSSCDASAHLKEQIKASDLVAKTPVLQSHFIAMNLSSAMVTTAAKNVTKDCDPFNCDLAKCDPATCGITCDPSKCKNR